jgi:hypothetical protein
LHLDGFYFTIIAVKVHSDREQFTIIWACYFYLLLHFHNIRTFSTYLLAVYECPTFCLSGLPSSYVNNIWMRMNEVVAFYRTT